MLHDSIYHQPEPSLAPTNDDASSRRSASSAGSAYSDNQDQSRRFESVVKTNHPSQSTLQPLVNSPVPSASKSQSVPGLDAKTIQHRTLVDDAVRTRLNVKVNSLVHEEGKRVAETDWNLKAFWGSSGNHRLHHLEKARLVVQRASLISNQIPWSEVCEESVVQHHTHPDGSLTAASKELVGPEVQRLMSVGYNKRMHDGHFDPPDPWVLRALKPEYLPPSTVIPTSEPVITQCRAPWDR